MYVIYINERPLTLLSEEEHRTRVRAHNDIRPQTHLVARYIGKPRTLLNYADMLEKGSPKVTSVDIVSEDLESLWEAFKSHYRWVPAAGGVVSPTGDTDKILFIFRRGYWDLPKGKIDDGEDAPTAALREVMEETGVHDLVLGEALPTTYHTYRNRKEKRILKPTFWFRMSTEPMALIPQKEEDIELAEWRTVDGILAEDAPFYQSLHWLVRQFLSPA